MGGLERQNIEAEIVQVKAAADARVAVIEAEGRAAAMKVMARAEADRIETVSNALESACPTAQQNETIRTSGQALSDKSTVVLSQDMRALAGTFGYRKIDHSGPPMTGKMTKRSSSDGGGAATAAAVGNDDDDSPYEAI